MGSLHPMRAVLLVLALWATTAAAAGPAAVDAAWLVGELRKLTPESEWPSSVEFARSIFPILVQSFSSGK